MERKLWHRIRSRWAAFVHDVVWIPLALVFAYSLRFNLGPIPEAFVPGLKLLIAVALPVQATAFWYFGLYRGIWRFASLPDVVRILRAVVVGSLATALIGFVLTRLQGVPRSVFVLYPMLLMAGLTIPRILYRWYKDRHFTIPTGSEKRALIVGAGRAGELLVRDLLRSRQYLPVGFLDDDPSKKGREIHGVRVIGRIEDMSKIVCDSGVDLVLLAMPSASSTTIRRIVNACSELGIPCRTLPTVSELADGRVEVSRLRKVQIEDLLGREPIRLDDAALSAFLKHRRVLVTGAGGSIGSELCRQILAYQPCCLIMVDHSEYNLYRIEQAFRERGSLERIRCLLGDVRDERRMRWIYEHFKPEVVFHAAAYKHVPLVEENPAEGVKTNVLGTKLLADLAVEFGVGKFVLVSTDKAVNPTNVMGASKRIAEIYCQNLQQRAGTRFITTRFGNVLGSTGSVVPRFRAQIEAGGPVTVTHPEIMRYFMTIPEAVGLILQAAAMGKGGEIFVLDMGKPVKIVELAEQMIRLSGLQPYKDIEIVFTGLRPGEKLYEELFYQDETPVGTAHPKLLLAGSRLEDWHRINVLITQLERACDTRDVKKLQRLLRYLVPEYMEAKPFEEPQSFAQAQEVAPGNKETR